MKNSSVIKNLPSILLLFYCSTLETFGKFGFLTGVEILSAWSPKFDWSECYYWQDNGKTQLFKLSGSWWKQSFHVLVFHIESCIMWSKKTLQHLLESIGRYIASSSLIGWFSLPSLPIGWSDDWRCPGSPLVLVWQPAGNRTGAGGGKNIAHRFAKTLQTFPFFIDLIEIFHESGEHFLKPDHL